MSENCIVVGASHAAAQLVTTLRESEWEGDILVIGDEHHAPYHRPPLSKAYLAGEKKIEDILIRPGEVYRNMDVAFRLDTHVDAIDRDNHRLVLDNGEFVPYDKLALTTGSRVRRMNNMPGITLSGIYYLRDTADVDLIRADLRPGCEVVIIGGGYIGLEAAAVLRKLGMNVTVLEMMDRVLQRVTAPQMSRFFTRVHEEEGVHILCGTGVTGFEGESRVEHVVCSDGQRLSAHIVIVGIGIVPNVELAQKAGLEVDNGIVVDGHARTADEDIYAAGDCTSHFNRHYDRRVRLECVQNATDQARVAALNLCGRETEYDALPWFWSDQYDLKLQIAGLSQGYDDVVVRGDVEQGRSCSAVYLRQGEVICVDAVNRPAEFMAGKRLIAARARPARDRLEDESAPLRDLIPK